MKDKYENYLVSVKLGFTQGSVIDNGIISVSFEHVPSVRNGEYYLHLYGLKISNKSDYPVVIDKARSYEMFRDGSFSAYYDGSKSTSISSGSSGGGSLNLGAATGALGIGGVVGQLASGISVGGGKSSGVTTVYNEQQFVMIPPKGWAYIEKPKKISKDEYLGSWEDFWVITRRKLPRNFVHKNEMKNLEESDEWILRKYGITFQYGEGLTKCGEMDFGLFIQQVFGEQLTGFWDSSKTIQKLEERIRKKLPEYSDGQQIIGLIGIEHKK